MGNSSDSFDAIKSKLDRLNSELTTAVFDLHTESIAIDDLSFEQLQPHQTFDVGFRITCSDVWRSKSTV
jgi:hypothetical protein